MRLLKDGRLEDDNFAIVEARAPVPEGGDVLVPLPRFLDEEAALKARAGRLGVLVEPADDALALEGRLEGVAVVAVRFPSFTDRRGYTHARLVRERLGFLGEIRATGDVGVDQLFYLRRCGFDAFLLREKEDPELALRALTRFSVAYQPAAWSPPA